MDLLVQLSYRYPDFPKDRIQTLAETDEAATVEAVLDWALESRIQLPQELANQLQAHVVRCLLT